MQSLIVVIHKTVPSALALRFYHVHGDLGQMWCHIRKVLLVLAFCLEDESIRIQSQRGKKRSGGSTLLNQSHIVRG